MPYRFSSVFWCLHPTGLSLYKRLLPARYPSPGVFLFHALSRHGLHQNPPMQMPGIRSNIQSHFLFSAFSLCHENARSRALRYLCTGAVYPYLYIKQLYTLPCVSRCQPPKSCRTLSILFICTRASIRYPSVRLSSKRPRQGLGRTFSLSSSCA